MKRTPLKRKTPIKSYKRLESRKPLGVRKKSRPGRKKAGRRHKPYWSIFTENMEECHITWDTRSVEPHHIFQGKAGKPLSEKYGFMVPLRSDWHRTGNYAIHRKRNFNVSYKMFCQYYYVHILGKTKEEWIKEFVKWWGVEDMVKEETGLEEIKNENGSSTIEINEGMIVYGVFDGQDGMHVSEGIVIKVGKGGFEVRYRKLPYPLTYSYIDVGREVYVDREHALRGSEDRDNERYEREREDFAEQNTQPSWKI